MTVERSGAESAYTVARQTLYSRIQYIHSCLRSQTLRQPVRPRENAKTCCPGAPRGHCLLSRGVTTLGAPTWGLRCGHPRHDRLWCDKGSRVNAGEDVAVIETDKVGRCQGFMGIVMEVLVNVVTRSR